MNIFVYGYRPAFLIGPFRGNREGRVASVLISSSWRTAPSGGWKSAMSNERFFLNIRENCSRVYSNLWKCIEHAL